MSNLNPYLIELMAHEQQLQRLREAKAHQLVKRTMAGKVRAYRPFEERFLTLVSVLWHRLHERAYVTAYNNRFGR
jgi:hypothetical protein